MVNYIVHFLTGKEIILYNHHRQTEPLANNLINKKNYLFIDVGLIWKYIPFKTSDKRKHRIMYAILSCIRPKYILSINWITKRESLYMVWTAKHSKSKFIVIQHGAYAGGTVSDVPHKYTKCDVFLTWGSFFIKQFKSYNLLKKVNIVNFGNSIYNTFNRTTFKYNIHTSGKILVLPTALNRQDIVYFEKLFNKLKEVGFEVTVKEHGKQGIEKDKQGVFKYPPIEGVSKITGQLYGILQQNDYDFVIADHSTSLLDAIFFKNRVLYFDALNNTRGYTTHYSNYLDNLQLRDFNSIVKNDFYNMLNIAKQEDLLAHMITAENNQIDSFCL